MGNDLRKQLENLREVNKKLKDELIRAYTDQMTGLWNRNFYENFKHKIESNKNPIGVIYIDANKLKKINDEFGHKVGDQYLADTAKLLLASVKRKSDFVFRMGGDEFVIILALTGDNPEIGLSVVLDRIDSKLEEANEQRGKNDLIEISIAIGSSIKSNGALLDDAIKTAEHLMYEHKQYQCKNNPELIR